MSEPGDEENNAALLSRFTKRSISGKPDELEKAVEEARDKSAKLRLAQKTQSVSLDEADKEQRKRKKQRNEVFSSDNVKNRNVVIKTTGQQSRISR